MEGKNLHISHNQNVQTNIRRKDLKDPEFGQLVLERHRVIRQIRGLACCWWQIL